MHAAALSSAPVVAPGSTPGQWGIVLHGIYGRGRNWSTVAKQVAARRSEWGFRLTDLRLHGDSPAGDPPHTLAACAADVAALTETMHARSDAVRAVIGHSFGGKVALALAPQLPQLDQVWIIDSTPAVRPPGGSAWEMLGLLRRLPASFASRAAAVAALEGAGLAPGVAAWMATNLRLASAGDAPEGGAREGYVWSLDFDAMEALLQDFFATDLWRIVETPPGRLVVHVVKAEESSTLDAAACARVEAAGRATGRTHLHRVAGGHWVNSENPPAIVELLATHLP